MTTTTELSSIAFDPDTGAVSLKLLKVQRDESGAVISRVPHARAFTPGDDVLAGLKAIDDHLSALGVKGLPDGVPDRLKSFIEPLWTPAMIDARKEKDRLAAEEAAKREAEAKELAAAEAEAAEKAEAQKKAEFDAAVELAVKKALAKG